MPCKSEINILTKKLTVTSVRCNPSFALQSVDPVDNLFPHFHTLTAIWALTQGYYVSIADDIGPQAAQGK
jgi:hypothetical protein